MLKQFLNTWKPESGHSWEAGLKKVEVVLQLLLFLGMESKKNKKTSLISSCKFPIWNIRLKKLLSHHRLHQSEGSRPNCIQEERVKQWLTLDSAGWTTVSSSSSSSPDEMCVRVPRPPPLMSPVFIFICSRTDSRLHPSADQSTKVRSPPRTCLHPCCLFPF